MASMSELDPQEVEAVIARRNAIVHEMMVLHRPGGTTDWGKWNGLYREFATLSEKLGEAVRNRSGMDMTQR